MTKIVYSSSNNLSLSLKMLPETRQIITFISICFFPIAQAVLCVQKPDNCPKLSTFFEVDFYGKYTLHNTCTAAGRELKLLSVHKTHNLLLDQPVTILFDKIINKRVRLSNNKPTLYLRHTDILQFMGELLMLKWLLHKTLVLHGNPVLQYQYRKTKILHSVYESTVCTTTTELICTETNDFKYSRHVQHK